MKAMIIKEFRQLRRDRRTLAMMIFLPVLLIVILGYAASFDVTKIPTVVSGPDARQVAAALPPPFQVTGTVPAAQAQTQLRDGHAAIAVVTGGPQVVIYLDGSQIFTAQAAKQALAAGRPRTRAWPRRRSRCSSTRRLKTSDIMIPGLSA